MRLLFHKKRPLGDILRYLCDQVLSALESESEIEILMTAMQSLKACVENACRIDWSAVAAPILEVSREARGGKGREGKRREAVGCRCLWSVSCSLCCDG